MNEFDIEKKVLPFTILIAISSIAWFIHEPSFEPYISLLGSISAMFMFAYKIKYFKVSDLKNRVESDPSKKTDPIKIDPNRLLIWSISFVALVVFILGFHTANSYLYEFNYNYPGFIYYSICIILGVFYCAFSLLVVSIYSILANLLDNQTKNVLLIYAGMLFISYCLAVLVYILYYSHKESFYSSFSYFIGLVLVINILLYLIAIIIPGIIYIIILFLGWLVDKGFMIIFTILFFVGIALLIYNFFN